MNATEQLAAVRLFIWQARDKAKATTDDDVHKVAGHAGKPSQIAADSYGCGIRDGVAEACDQVLTYMAVIGGPNKSTIPPHNPSDDV